MTESVHTLRQFYAMSARLQAAGQSGRPWSGCGPQCDKSARKALACSRVDVSLPSWLPRPGFAGRGLRRGLHPRILPWLVLSAGLLITLLLCVEQRRFSRLEHERLERVLADDITAALRSRLATNEAILAAVAGLFDASEEVTAPEFARFYRSLTVNNANLAGIQGVGFAALIPPGQALRFEDRIRRQGQRQFRIRPPGERRPMSAIVYLQPTDWRNERAMGFDMLSEANRRQAMEWSVIANEAVLSGPVRLLQETNDRPQMGAVLYAPIYAGEGGFGSGHERWQRLRGWAYSPLRMGDLVASALNTVQNPDRVDAAVLLYDGDRPQPQRLLYDSHGLAASPVLESITWMPLQLANRSWLLGVQLSHRHHGLSEDNRDLLLPGLLGICLSLLAALLTARLVTNHLSLQQALQREAQASRERALAAAVFDTTPVGIVVTDPNGMIVHVNQAFTQISGYSELEARGHKANLLRSGRHDIAFYQQMWEAIVQRGHWNGEIWNRHRNGQIRRHELTITAVFDGQQQIINFVGLLRDVTERYSQDRHIRHLATHDSLTGLANRALLMEELQRSLALAQRRGEAVGLLFLDLNGFKAVNDGHGHSCGDVLLQAVARRLRQAVRGSDLLCRHGGDEFVLMIPEAPDCVQLRGIAAKLAASLDAPYPELPEGIGISVSIGVARWPDHATDADGLLQAADRAMYVAKQQAGGPDAIAVAEAPQPTAAAADSTPVVPAVLREPPTR